MTAVDRLEAARYVRRAEAEAFAIQDGYLSTVAWVRDRHQGVFAALGEAVVDAACRQVAPGVCRGCLADAFAQVRGLPAPPRDAATRLLLGDACPRCRARHQAAALGRAAAHFASGDQTAAARELVAVGLTDSEARAALTAAARPYRATPHEPRECWKCAAHGQRVALVAAGSVPSDVAGRHARAPWPTGQVLTLADLVPPRAGRP